MLVALGAMRATYQTIATQRNAWAFPPLGQLVDVGGYRLHLYCVGQGRPAAQAQAAGSLGDIPLLVVTATDHGFPPVVAAELETQWLTRQNELAALSTNRMFILEKSE